jgi:hypothetical protein
MEALRIVLALLAIIPIAILIDAALHPTSLAEGTLSEMLYLIFGVPILIINIWAWVHPEIIQFFLFRKKE